jgi:Family of unknown function (DUF5993)
MSSLPPARSSEACNSPRCFWPSRSRCWSPGGDRALALALFAATLVACIATYLHHASDVLKLSF